MSCFHRGRVVKDNTGNENVQVQTNLHFYGKKQSTVKCTFPFKCHVFSQNFKWEVCIVACTNGVWPIELLNCMHRVLLGESETY